MSAPRAPWWMYVIAASFLAFFALLSYYDFFGPNVPVVDFGFPSEHLKGRLTGAPMSQALERAGAKPGDYLVRVDGQELHTVSDWVAIAANLEAGRRVRLGIERGGRQFEVEATFEGHQISGSIDDLVVLTPSNFSSWSSVFLSLSAARGTCQHAWARCFWRQEPSAHYIIWGPALQQDGGTFLRWPGHSYGFLASPGLCWGRSFALSSPLFPAGSSAHSGHGPSSGHRRSCLFPRTFGIPSRWSTSRRTPQASSRTR